MIILSNAAKYTEKGHIDFNVTCINEKSKCKLQIIISDTGREIKPKQIDNFNTPVVALTADAMEGKSTKYIEVGSNDYLSKSINEDELKRVSDKCLNVNIEIAEEKKPEEDPNIHRVIPITDEDIEILNKKLTEDLAKQK